MRVEIEEGEEAVGGLVGFAAMADEGEEMTVRREGEGAGGTAIEDELVGGRGVGDVGDPDLSVVDEEEAVAVGREERRVTFADENRLSSGGEWLDEDFDRRGVLEVGRVGGLAIGSGFGAIGVSNGGGIGRPG